MMRDAVKGLQKARAASEGFHGGVLGTGGSKLSRRAGCSEIFQKVPVETEYIK